MQQLFSFYSLVNNLKFTYRHGTSDVKVKESTAAHTWRLMLMAWTLHDELKLSLDINKAMKIALVHDIAEAIAGDVDYRDIVEGRITKKEKEQMEREAMEKIRDSHQIGHEVFALWQEYENAQTPEARFIKAVDKIETASQLVEYGPEVFTVPKIIPTYADKAVRNFPELLPVLREVKSKLKEVFLREGLSWEQEYDFGLRE